ncbi:Lar family restriction alleviation protein [Mesorhizobium sp.]|uniref:Lar family restriction alleviation protein n=1 Tax=Mesorhizobium sp. TaxID=1871066 RepID=UPI000FE61922|nr:Lar family restriction alleviation protein [Mesorhizobium sp.]RWO57266.1 MAG: restriction alleviation protein, Lar family [Mesorhizobium sp.]
MTNETSAALTALMPCPFCGGKAAITDQEPFSVECVEERCNVDGPCHADKADAIAAWNRRAVPAVAVKGLTDAEIKKLWRQNGGSQHGPHVETYTIPEVGFFGFVVDMENRIREIEQALAPAAPMKLHIDKEWLKRKIEEDGEECEIGAGFELFPTQAVPDTRGAIADIAAERQRQITSEGWSPEHDDQHDKGELAEAASCYARGSDRVTWMQSDPEFPRHKVMTGRIIWPWSPEWWKPTDRRRNLVKAGALIIAEIERLDRAAARQVEKVDD